MISPYRKEHDVDNGETSRQRKVDSSFNARFTDGGILLSSNTISWARKSSIFPLIRCGKLNRQLSSTLLNLATVFKDYKVWSALVLRLAFPDTRSPMYAEDYDERLEHRVISKHRPSSIQQACISSSLYSFYNNRKRWFPPRQWVDLVSFIF